MKKIWTWCLALALAAGAFSIACTEEDVTEGEDEAFLAITPQGERWINVEDICPDTLSPMPPGTIAVPDPDNNRIIFESAYYEEEGGGGEEGDTTCTCKEGSGGCHPFCAPGRGCGCALADPCTRCTKTTTEALE